ncbi:MAG TPA: phytanoyl-CoA dioxygenase family protein [Planctomycetaceae bacterium]|nr:phytanoyl-CoA dioxygenase family protein [Planctomycetaceae bacterium]
MAFFEANASDIAQFQETGYVLVRGLYASEEVAALGQYARADQRIATRATSRSDAAGGTTTLSLDNELTDNLYADVVKSQRVARNMERFLGDEVYHYHHKMMLKEPRIGGAWEWHQDYGYWYDFGCLFPTMASCFIAIDPSTRANGCLQVIPRSHQLGRMNHMKVGGQTGADPERVTAVLERMPVEYVEMDPGDGLFFHGNLLHRSDQNTSPDPRWSLICCYNTKSNDPYKESRHPAYSPLGNLPDEDFLATAQEKLDRLNNA